LTTQLAQRSAALSFDQRPDDVVTMARLCVLDWLGVTIVGSREPAPRILLRSLPPASSADGVSVIGHHIRLDPLRAALVNGTSSHVLDFDDTNATLIGHPSVAILGALLALAESLDSRGPELLCAFVAGYETACRVGAAIGVASYVRGFHNTGTIGTLAAAAACAHLLGLDAERTATALALAATQAAGLGCMVGTMSKSLHAGKACENGLLAAAPRRGGTRYLRVAATEHGTGSQVQRRAFGRHGGPQPFDRGHRRGGGQGSGGDRIPQQGNCYR
jgi:2-methylcitrate dehydratase PrpD